MTKRQMTPSESEQYDFLIDKYGELLTLIDTHISSPRKERLVELHNKFQDRVLSSPASYKEHFHNAFYGGYLLHVLNVIHHGLDLYNLWKSWGVVMDDFGEEEVVFCALMHDFGKLGLEEAPYYTPSTSDWHRKNLGVVYDINKGLQPYMETTVRTLFLMQKYDIILNETEYLGILLAEGLYNDMTHRNLLQGDASKKLKTALPHIIHQADMSATVREYLTWHKETTEADEGEVLPVKKKEKFQVKENKLSTSDIERLKGTFKDVFEKDK